MNLLDNFLLFGIYQGLLLLFLFSIGKLQTSKSKILFGVLILVLLLRLIEFLLWKIGALNPHLVYFSVPLTLLIAPITYLYLDNIFFDSKIRPSFLVLHSIPFLTSLVILIPFYSLDPTSKLTYVQSIKISGLFSTTHLIYLILLVLQFGLYFVLIIKLFRRYIIDFTSSRSDGRLEVVLWAKAFFYSVIAFLGMYSIAYIVLVSKPSFYIHLETTTYLVLCLAIQILLYFFVRTRFSAFNQLKIEKTKYYSSNIQGMDFEPFITKLRAVILEEKMYLDHDLRISKLADVLNIPAPHMSQMISEGAKTTFYDFVNEYRIEEAKKLLLMEKYKRFTLLAVAMDAGFSNKTTFNRTFKKYTNMTPSEYIKKYRDS